MRQLTEEEKRQVRALMRQVGDWLWPTRESVQLERELNGSLARARERVAHLQPRPDAVPAKNVAQRDSTGRRRA
jgi:hypothetical protein